MHDREISPVRYYSFSDLTLKSHIPLDLDLSSRREQDLSVKTREFPLNLTNPTISRAIWSANSSEFLISVPSLGKVLARGGRELILGSHPEPNRKALTRLVTDFGMGPILSQRGELLFHASVATVKGKTILFCGPPASGKTLLCLKIAAEHGEMVADAICRTRIDNGNWLIRRFDTRVQAHQDVLDLIGNKDDRQPFPEPQEREIDVVVFLQPRNEAEVELIPLRGRQKVSHLLQNITPYSLPQLAPVMRSLLPLIDALPVFKAVFPFGSKPLETLARKVRRL